MNKQKKMIILVLVVALIGIVLGIIFGVGSSGRALRAQLDLGNKYLAEEEYENAKVAFEKALEIDPKSEEALIGLANAYVGLANAYVGLANALLGKDDLESALALVEEGQQRTNNDTLVQKKAEYRCKFSSGNEC